MFVIADIRHKIPSYFWKKDSTGRSLICIDLKMAMKFSSNKEAKEMLATLIQDELFTFSVHELGIK